MRVMAEKNNRTVAKSAGVNRGNVTKKRARTKIAGSAIPPKCTAEDSDAYNIVGRDGKTIRPVRFLRGRPVYAATDVPNMEARYSENIDK